jgi:hypothetical protein
MPFLKNGEQEVKTVFSTTHIHFFTDLKAEKSKNKELYSFW